MSATVLVVDDSITVREQVARTLTAAGFQVKQAADGLEGINVIEEGGLSCVICDVNMPHKNGIELVEAVRADERFSSLPIVMLTTEGARELIARAKTAGASGWIVKPFKPELLVAAVDRLVSPVSA